jgi:hypothetical protein
LLSDASQVTAAIDRLVAFADAGADCLYAPGVQKREDIAAMVAAVAPKPVNVLMTGPGLVLAELADLGVRRVSIGGALARVAWGAMLKVAEEIKRGSFDGLSGAARARSSTASSGNSTLASRNAQPEIKSRVSNLTLVVPRGYPIFRAGITPILERKLPCRFGNNCPGWQPRSALRWFWPAAASTPFPPRIRR